MKRLVKVFYDGSVTQTVSSLLQMGDKKLSEAELEELSALVDAAKRNRKKSS